MESAPASGECGELLIPSYSLTIFVSDSRNASLQSIFKELTFIIHGHSMGRCGVAVVKSKSMST